MRKVITKVNNNQFILTNKMKFDIYDVLEVMYQEAGSRKQEAGSSPPERPPDHPGRTDLFSRAGTQEARCENHLLILTHAYH